MHRNGVTVVLVQRLALIVLVAGAGVGVARLADLHNLPSSAGYLWTATVLLAVGLYSATYEISGADLLGKRGLVLTAVTFGVVIKAALIAAAMYVVFRAPEYIVLGVAVAQIDPLSVAVMQHRSRLSAQAKAILAAWSSFDDPVTAILAVYLSTVALNLSLLERPDNDLLGGYSSVWVDVLLNALLAVVAFVVWHVMRALARHRGDEHTPATWPWWLRALAVVALLITGAVGVMEFLMLGIALTGLFFRPGIGAALRWVTPAALIVAVFMLGLVLAGGVDLAPGLVLGVFAFGAQVLVGLAFVRSMPSWDRIRLALSQQNGITAIVLALLLETIFPGTVAVVGPAILVIGVLHLVSNAIADRIEDSAREKSNNRSTDIDGESLEFRPEGS
jgi:NhaP-type Na+/H+ or K+/H+ antiporter